MLAGGRVSAAGPLGEVLSSRALSDCYGLALRQSTGAGRWTVREAPGP